MAIVGALPRPDYTGRWVFSFAGVSKLVKHTVRALNSHFYTSKDVGDSKLLKAKKAKRWKGTDWGNISVGKRFTVQS